MTTFPPGPIVVFSFAHLCRQFVPSCLTTRQSQQLGIKTEHGVFRIRQVQSLAQSQRGFAHRDSRTVINVKIVIFVPPQKIGLTATVERLVEFTLLGTTQS